MRWIGFVILAHQCCWALTCTPIVELPLDEPHLGIPARNTCLAVNERGEAALLWKDYEVVFSPPSEEGEEGEYGPQYSLKIAFTEKDGWTAPHILLDKADEVEELHCTVDSTGNITAAWKRGVDIFTMRRNGEGMWTHPTVLPLEEKTGGLPFALDSTGNIVYPPAEAIGLGSWVWIDGDLAMDITEAGKKVCFWEEDEGTFSLAWREKEDWQREDVAASWPYFKGAQDLRVAMDPKGNVWVVGTVFSSETREEGRAIWAWSRSAEGIWSDPLFISGHCERITDLQMAIDPAGHLLVVWQACNGELYSVSKPVDQRWSLPERIIAPTETYKYKRLFEENMKPVLQRDSSGHFVLVWQNMVFVRGGGILQATIYGAVFSSDRQEWSTPQCLIEAGKDGLLGSFVMDKRGEGILVWGEVSDEDELQGHLQVAKLSLDANELN